MTSNTAPGYRRLFSYIRFIRARMGLFAGLLVAFVVLGLIDSAYSFIGDADASHTTPATAVGLLLIAINVATFRWLTRSPPWKIGIAFLATTICALRVLETLVPPLGLNISTLLSPAPDGFFSGGFGFESALMIGCIMVAGIFRRSRSLVGEVALTIAVGTVFFDILQVLYASNVFDGQTGRFTMLADIAACAGLTAIYATRRFFRVLFLRSWIGFHTRIITTAMVLTLGFCGWLFARFSDAPEQSIMTGTLIIAVLTGLVFFAVIRLANLHDQADSHRRRAERKLERLSRTDTLTGVLNRKGMADSLEDAWRDFQQNGTRYGVILVDLDHFKRINDVYGHAAGDQVLTAVGGALRKVVRPEDVVGRWGGEEFLVLLALEQGGSLGGMAERLREAIENVPDMVAETSEAEHQVAFPSCPVTGSVGVTEFRRGDATPDVTLERADRCLYEAKADGRNRVVLAPKVAA